MIVHFTALASLIWTERMLYGSCCSAAGAEQDKSIPLAGALCRSAMMGPRTLSTSQVKRVRKLVCRHRPMPSSTICQAHSARTRTRNCNCRHCGACLTPPGGRGAPQAQTQECTPGASAGVYPRRTCRDVPQAQTRGCAQRCALRAPTRSVEAAAAARSELTWRKSKQGPPDPLATTDSTGCRETKGPAPEGPEGPEGPLPPPLPARWGLEASVLRSWASRVEVPGCSFSPESAEAARRGAEGPLAVSSVPLLPPASAPPVAYAASRRMEQYCNTWQGGRQETKRGGGVPMFGMRTEDQGDSPTRHQCNHFCNTWHQE